MKNESEESLCVPGVPGEGSITSLVPQELLARMYPS
jgi:hypothetical protein